METATIAGRAEDRLVDRYLPEFDVTSSFHRPVDAPPELVYAAMTRLRPLDRVAAGLVAIGLGDRLVSPPLLRAADDGAPALGLLGVDPGRAVAFGLVWRVDGDVPATPASFDEVTAGGYAKLVWTLTVRPDGEGRSLLSSDVRVHALDALTSRRLRDGWAVVGPLVEAQARRMLSSVATAVDTDEEDDWAPGAVMAPRLWLRAAGL